MLKISFFSLKISCHYIYAFQTDTDRGIMVKNSYTSFFILYFPLLMKLLFSAEKKQQHWFLKITLCVKAVINMKDNCSLNFDKYHL